MKRREWSSRRLHNTFGSVAKAGVTPLLCAYRNQNVELVRLLLDHGAIVAAPPVCFRCVKVRF